MADDVVIRLILDTARYVPASKQAAQKTSELSAKVTAASKGFSSLSTALKGAGAAFGASKVLGFAQDSLTAYSNLAESVNAVNQVFGDAADTILRFGEDAAQSVGLANSEFNQLATSTGAMLRNFGLSAADTADQTITLTTRAADLASVFNTDVASALEAINSAMRGQSEPIRRYGIDTSQAALHQEALAQGIEKSVSEMTQQEQAQLRISAIMRQSSAAAGDFAATADSMANTQRRLAAEIENTKARIGEKLQPAMSSLLATAEALVPVLELVGVTLASLTNPLGMATERFNGWSLGLGILTGNLQATGAQTVALGRDISGVNDDIDAQKEHLTALNTRQRNYAEYAGKGRQYAEALGIQIQTTGDKMSLHAIATQRAADMIDVYGSRWREAHGDLTAADDAVDDLADSINTAVSSIVDLFAQAPTQIKMSTSEILSNLRSQAETAASFRTNLRALAAAGLDELVAELERQGPAAAEAAALFAGDVTDAFEANLLIADIVGSSVNNLDSATLTARLEALGLTLAEALNRGFNLRGLATTPSIHPSRSGITRARAAGGWFHSGDALIVGERGPEILYPRTSGFVQPNMGGSTEIHIHQPNTTDLRQDIRAGLIASGVTELMAVRR